MSVKECCPAGVGALGDVITEDEFEDGDPGVLELWRLTMEGDVAEFDAWFTYKKSKAKQISSKYSFFKVFYLFRYIPKILPVTGWH